MKYLAPLFLFLISCSRLDGELPDNCFLRIDDNSYSGKIYLNKLKSSKGFRLQLVNREGIMTDNLIFSYSPYRLDTADINRDGKTDILVGLIKETRFDPTEKKRLFILQIDDGELRPLWLGSKVCQELINFKTLNNGIVQTLEKTNSGNYSIGKYEWQNFGLALIQYTHNELSFYDASEIFMR